MCLYVKIENISQISQKEQGVIVTNQEKSGCYEEWVGVHCQAVVGQEESSQLGGRQALASNV